jgi:hypothetical protein
VGAEVAGGTGGKLTAAVRVWLANPRWRIPCSDCELIQFDRTGRAFPRGDAPTPCESCPKVPESVKATGADWRECRAAANEFTPENRAAFDAYFAFGPDAPADPVFRWHSGIVRRAIAEYEADTAAATADGLARLTLAVLKRR